MCPHVATFRGKHNELKVKVLWLLYEGKAQGIKSYTAREITELLGVNYKSLLVSLSKWVRWGYIGRLDSYGCYRYRLLTKGSTFIQIALMIAPMDRYKRDILAHQEGKV